MNGRRVFIALLIGTLGAACGGSSGGEDTPVVATCEGGACGADSASSGTDASSPKVCISDEGLAQEKGDCKKAICDASGAIVTVASEQHHEARSCLARPSFFRLSPCALVNTRHMPGQNAANPWCSFTSSSRHNRCLGRLDPRSGSTARRVTFLGQIELDPAPDRGRRKRIRGLGSALVIGQPGSLAVVPWVARIHGVDDGARCCGRHGDDVSVAPGPLTRSSGWLAGA
jgi:hypothetical protein